MWYVQHNFYYWVNPQFFKKKLEVTITNFHKISFKFWPVSIVKKWSFAVSPDVQPKLEYSYSVFVLDDAGGDGGNEWEPESSDPGDLVCPIASSEYTSLEPVGESVF